MKPHRQESIRQRKLSEDALFEAIVSLRNIDEGRNFFRDLCTPAELQALVDRWQVVKLLKQDLPYRQIRTMTGVSVTTIGRVARSLTDGFGGYQTAFARTGTTPSSGGARTNG
jgi:TrpR-related protein YerC/YecD